jgi:murein DD-endopeptidase MepM/ murein hydrolase activator NlpD
MYFKKRIKNSPRSDLRSRLDEYSSLREKTWWPGEEEAGPETLFDCFPFSVLKEMHRALPIKITAGLLTILLVTSFTFTRLPLAVSFLEKIQYITTWQMDFAALGREAIPVIKKLWTGNLEAELEKVVLAPGSISSPGKEERLLAPLEGDLVKNFGFQFNPLLQKDEMFYGLVFAVPAGAEVRAAASGRVKEMRMHPAYGLFLLLEHTAGKETVYGYLQKALAQKLSCPASYINAGGDINIVGSKPDGEKWKIAIQDPLDPQKWAAIVPLQEGSIATSGDYQRYFEEGGKKFHHLLDPGKGMPASGVHSVTVVAPEALTADALATAVFVLGREAGMRLLESLDGVEGAIIDVEGIVHVSSGLAADIEILSSQEPACGGKGN